MNHTYANRKRTEKAALNTVTPREEQGPSPDALRSGAAAPTTEQMGHRVDLPDAMREKMESAFGADLSAVKLYESEAVADAGANAITQGANVAFAPGMLDFTSYGGQALLGHELSHVVSQARGEVTGGGFLNDASLEARADREGAMAAAGEQVSIPAIPLSPVSAASAAGPMQADKPWNRRQADAPAPAETAAPSYTPEEQARAQTALGGIANDGRSAEVNDYFTRKFGSKDAHGLTDMNMLRFFSRQSYGKTDEEKDALYSKFTDPSKREEFLQYVRDVHAQTLSTDMEQYHNQSREQLLSNSVNASSAATDIMALSDVVKANRQDLRLSKKQNREFGSRLAYMMAVKGNDRDRLREITGEREHGYAAQSDAAQANFGPSGVNQGYKAFHKRYLKENKNRRLW